MGRELPAAVRPGERRQPAAGAWIPGRAASLAHAGLHAARRRCCGASRRRWPASGRCSPPPTSAARAWPRGCSRRRSTGRAPAAPSWGWSRGRAGCTSARASSPTPCAGATGWPAGATASGDASALVALHAGGRSSDLARLHDAEPTRFASLARPSGGRWPAPGWCSTTRAGCSWSCRLGRSAAGLPGGGRPGGAGWATGGRGCWSWRGTGEAIADAAPGAGADARDCRAIDLILPAHDDSLEALAGQLGWAADLSCPGLLHVPGWNPACHSLPLPFYGLDYV